jgi:hypothetical protein
MSTIGDKVVKNIYVIIAIILLIFLLILFFVHLYFNIRASYFPQQYKNNEKETLFYKRLKYIIIFSLFLIILLLLYLVNPWNVMTNYFGSVILISIVIGTFIITMISWYNYAYKKEGKIIDISLSFKEEKTPPPVNYFYRSLIFLLFGAIFAGILYLLVYLIDPLSSSSSSSMNNIVSFLLNIFIIVVIIALVYKIFNVNNNSTIFDLLSKVFVFFKNIVIYLISFITKEVKSTTIGSVIALILMCIILYVIYKFPNLKEKINLQGGKQLINKPVHLNKFNVIASYEDLNGSDNFEYEYAISFWVFVNSYNPSTTNNSYDRYVSIMNYGNNPNVLYNINTNSLMVTMVQTELVDTNNNTFELDANGNRIIFVKKNLLLQKWNNIIINYSGGTLDVFLNGDLVKSTVGIVPYMKLDNMTIGSEHGIGGGICNLVFYKKALTTNNIYYIYNMVKNKDPPVVDNFKDNFLIH